MEEGSDEEYEESENEVPLRERLRNAGAAATAALETARELETSQR